MNGLRHTIQLSAQDRAGFLKPPVCSPLHNNARGWIVGGKVAFEGDVALCHVQAGAHAFKGTTPAIISTLADLQGELAT